MASGYAPSGTSTTSTTSTTRATSATIEIRVLGTAEVTVGGARIEIPARKERALLAALALRAGHQVPLHEIAAALWGDPAPATARKSLQVHVSRLRRRLQTVVEQPAAEGERHPLLTTVDDGYALLVEPDDVDANRFERLTAEGRRAIVAGEPDRATALISEALALWRGDPLPELSDTPVGDAEIARLSELRIVAIECGHVAELALGGHAALIGRIESLLAEQPLRENLWCHLMLSLYRSGRQADALRAFQRARNILVEELGIEPGPDLRRLEAAIVAQDPALDLAPVAVPPPAPLPAPVPAPVDSPVVPRASWAERLRVGEFVDRATELERFAEAYRAAEHGVSVVAVSGDAGVGKTRLVAEAVAHPADKGALVLVGTCSDEHADRGPLHEMIDRAPGPERPRRAGEQGPERPDVVTSDPAVLARALRAIIRVDDGAVPAVVVLDDFHLAGPLTMRAVRKIIDTMSGTPMLLVLAFQGCETRGDPRLLDLLDDLHRVPSYERIGLHGLEDAEGAALLADRLGGDAMNEEDLCSLALLSRDVGGNPRYLVQLARHLARSRRTVGDDRVPADLTTLGLPAGIRDLVRRRLRVLHPTLRNLLEIASVIGEEFDLDVVARVASITPSDLIVPIEAAVDAGLLAAAEPGRAAFSCAVVRQTIRADLPGSRRSALSERVAMVTAALGDVCGDTTTTESSEAIDAYLDAVLDIERVLGGEGGRDDPESRLRVLLGLGSDRLASGHLGVARALFERAAAGAVDLGCPKLLADAALGLARAVGEVGVCHERVVELLRAASARLDPRDERQARIGRALVPELLWAGDWGGALAAGEGAPINERRRAALAPASSMP